MTLGGAWMWYNDVDMNIWWCKENICLFVFECFLWRGETMLLWLLCDIMRRCNNVKDIYG